MVKRRTDSRKQAVRFDLAEYDEIRHEAHRLGSSISEIMQLAWRIARDQIQREHRAMRATEDIELSEKAWSVICDCDSPDRVIWATLEREQLKEEARQNGERYGQHEHTSWRTNHIPAWTKHRSTRCDYGANRKHARRESAQGVDVEQ